MLITIFSDIMDDHLLNATYYSPELEEPLESTAMLGNIVHSDSPTRHVEHAGSVGKKTFALVTVALFKATNNPSISRRENDKA